jgi:hypothetical protein
MGRQYGLEESGWPREIGGFEVKSIGVRGFQEHIDEIRESRKSWDWTI